MEFSSDARNKINIYEPQFWGFYYRRTINKLIKRGIFFICTIISFVFLGTSTAIADSNDFSISPVLPSNQRIDVESYFDLLVTPKERQTIAIIIKNNSANSQKYNLFINTATTNQNGIVDYSMTNFEKDESMLISLKDLISLNTPEVEVDANSQKEVFFDLTVPEEPFEGILLGGITVEPVVEENTEGISNLVTRTLAIQLSESDEKVEPNLESGGVTLSQENYRNNVKIELRNTTPTLINRVSAEISIIKNENNALVLEQTREQLSIAPNSKFNLMSEWNDQFDVGMYTYKIKLADSQGHDWEFSEEFEITAKEATELNKTSYDNVQYSLLNYIPLLLGGLLFLAFIFLFITRKRNKKS